MAWALNGGSSVFGSTLTVLISMTYGFSASFLTGALAYAIALGGAIWMTRSAVAGPLALDAAGVQDKGGPATSPP